MCINISKRLFAVIIAFTLLLSFSGCGGTAKTSETSPVISNTAETSSTTLASTGTTSDTGSSSLFDFDHYVKKWGFDTTPITMTAYMDYPQPINCKWGDDDTSKYITKTIGVTLDITYATNSDGTELSLKLASGEKLPDFIVTNSTGSNAVALCREKLVQPLNKLADQHFPAFNELLPGQMREIYNQKDGNLYNTVDWYGDPKKLAQCQIPTYSNQDITINKPIWDELGSPAIETLDDLLSVLKLVKEKKPDIKYPIFTTNIKNTPFGDQDMINIFYRIYGGKDYVYFDSNNKLSYCATDTKYKQALAYLNKLYREKVFNPEIFTMSTDAAKSVLKDSSMFTYFGQESIWISATPDGNNQKEGCPVYGILPPTATGVSRDQIQFKDYNLSIGGWHGTFISNDCSNPKRAIEYLAFRYTNEMQCVERFGVLGRGLVMAEDGTPTYSKESLDAQAKMGFAKAEAIYGQNNWNTSWFTTNFICTVGLQNDLKSQPGFAQIVKMYSPMAKNERIYELARNITDEAIKVTNQKVVLVWQEYVPKLILSDTEEEFNSQFDQFIKAMNSAGLNTVNDYLNQNYLNWKSKMGE